MSNIIGELYAKRLGCTLEELENTLHTLPIEKELEATLKATSKKTRITLQDILKEVI